MYYDELSDPLQPSEEDLIDEVTEMIAEWQNPRYPTGPFPELPRGLATRIVRYMLEFGPLVATPQIVDKPRL